MNKKQKLIKHVAIYLRKSRDEGEYEDVLSKHRDTLVAKAKSNGWSYKLYEEIGSGERISGRKKMQQLLRDVENEFYDGVMVMDIDRLGRGNHADWATICEAFMGSETYIITPQMTYNLSEDQDEMVFDFQAIFAKMEYKMIKKRMKQGKIAGAKKGMWTNGCPPYPYVYNPATRQLDVDEEKEKIYRIIIHKFLSGMSARRIAEWLNKEKVAPPYSGKRNKHGWSNNSVNRLLVNEIHLGYVIYGKTQSSHGMVEVINKENWIKVKGTHKPLKTEKEHEMILQRMAENKIIAKRSRKGILPLSGLLYCAKCGYAMQYRKHIGKKECYWTALCVHAYPDGTKCKQKGRKLDSDFYQVLYNTITKVDVQSLSMVEENDNQYIEARTLLDVKTKEIAQIEHAIEKLLELYEEGMIDKDRFASRLAMHKENKKEAQNAIERYQKILIANSNRVTVENIQQRVDEFKYSWSKAATTSERNSAYKLLIDKIFYDRENNEITLEILYR